MLNNSIQQITDWQSKTAEEILSKLNAATIPYRDDQLWTWAGVALAAGPEGAEGLRIALEANSMGWAVHQLGGSGLQLSSDLVQPVLYAFAQAGVPNMDTLALAVKRNVSMADRDSLGTVTTEQVEAVLASMQLNDLRREKVVAASDRYNTYVAAIDAWDGTGEEPVL